MNVISTCKSLEKAWDKVDSSQQLQITTDILFKEKGLKVEFCQIIGKRWSHLVGHPDFTGYGERFILNEKLGMIIEEANIPQDELSEILKFLKLKLKTSDSA